MELEAELVEDAQIAEDTMHDEVHLCMCVSMRMSMCVSMRVRERA